MAISETTTSESPEPDRRRARIVRTVVKWTVGLVLLAAVVGYQDAGREAIRSFRNFRWELLIPLTVVTLAMLLVSCYKWGLFLRARGFRPPMTRLVGLYWIGRFFDNFLPSTIGSDSLRTIGLGRSINNRGVALASVLLERYTGILGLLLLALVAAAAPGQLAVGTRAAMIGVCAVGCTIALAATSISTKTMPGRFRRAIPARLFEKLGRLREELLFFRGHRRLWASAIVLSVVNHVGAGIKIYLACLCVSAESPFWPIMAVAPMILLCAIIPVSAGNLGWSEWTFTALLSTAGLEFSEGLAAALTLRGYSIAFSLLGGVWLCCTRLPGVGEAQAPMPRDATSQVEPTSDASSVPSP